LGKATNVDELLGAVEERIVGRDNVVSFDGVALQIAK